MKPLFAVAKGAKRGGTRNTEPAEPLVGPVLVQSGAPVVSGADATMMTITTKVQQLQVSH